MAETTKIEWADSTLNIWEGCQKTGSPACEGCYAEARNLRYAPKGSTTAPNWGPRAPRRELKGWRAMLRKISRLALAAFAAGRKEPWFVFVNSLSDFWDNQADPQLRAEAMAAFREHPHLTFLLLTKRPQNIVKMFAEVMRITAEEHGPLDACWPRNVAIGCTMVTQKEFDRDGGTMAIAKAALKPAFVFASIEPMAEAMDISIGLITGTFDWIITGGGTDQSKWKAPPMHPAWPLQIAADCAIAGTAFLHKQNGEWLLQGEVVVEKRDIERWSEQGRPKTLLISPKEAIMIGNETLAGDMVPFFLKVRKQNAGRMLDGRTHDARPEVRQ